MVIDRSIISCFITNVRKGIYVKELIDIANEKMYLYIIPNYPNENKENFIHGMIVDYNTVKFGANTTDKKSFVPDSICLKKNRLVNCEIVNLLLHKDISFY